ncbi:MULTISPECIES: hypothetical protein [unclassified Microbacterium]
MRGAVPWHRLLHLSGPGRRIASDHLSNHVSDADTGVVAHGGAHRAP